MTKQEYNAAYRTKNREKLRQKGCEYRAAHLKNKEAYRIRNREELRRKSREYRAAHPEKRKQEYRNYRLTPNGYFAATFKGCVNRAKKRRLQCTITRDFLVKLFELQNHHCALTGREMTLGDGGPPQPDRASIDRIDQSKGYTEDNVRLVCLWVNIARWNWSDDILYDWCDAVMFQNRNRYQEA